MVCVDATHAHGTIVYNFHLISDVVVNHDYMGNAFLVVGVFPTSRIEQCQPYCDKQQERLTPNGDIWHTQNSFTLQEPNLQLLEARVCPLCS